MHNNIKWETVASETFLDVDVRLNLVLEVSLGINIRKDGEKKFRCYL